MLSTRVVPGMGLDDKMKVKDKSEDVKGHVKEAVGEATDNPRLEGERRADQADAHVREAGEHVRDVARDVKDAFAN